MLTILQKNIIRKNNFLGGGLDNGVKGFKEKILYGHHLRNEVKYKDYLAIKKRLENNKPQKVKKVFNGQVLDWWTEFIF